MQPAIGVKDYAAREVNQAQLDAAQAACQPHSNQPMYSIAPSCRPALYLALGSNVSCSGGDACYHIITPLTINVSNICRQQREQAGRSSCVGGRQAGPHVWGDHATQHDVVHHGASGAIDCPQGSRKGV